MSDEELLRQIKAGNAQPVEMWLQLRGLILKLAAPYVSTGKVESDDLQQEAYFAVLDAVRMYDCNGGARFARYAAFWLRQRFQRYIENAGESIHVPSWAKLRINKYRKMQSEFERDFGRSPTDEEVKTALGCTTEQIEREAAALAVGSLDVPIGPEEDTSSIAEMVEDVSVDVESEVLEKVDQEQLQATIWKLVDELPERQAKTLRGRYQDGKTLKQCGDDMGITPEAVRQHELKALRKLRNIRVKRELEPYLDEVRYSVGVKSGRDRFTNTGISPTEAAAFKALAAAKGLHGLID